jgi:hypothetical protein
MEAGRRRGRGRMSRTRTRTPANPRNRAAPPREDDTTIALLRQQQQIMAQMVEQQQRTNTVIELLATRLVQLPEARAPRHLRWSFDRRRRPHQDRRYPSHRWILSCHHVLPNEHRTGKLSRKPRIGVELHWRWPPAHRKLQDNAQLSQVWTRRTQPNSWRSMSGTPWTPKYPLKRSCKWQSFTEFRAEFLAAYWSVGQQLAVRALVLSQHYDRTKGDSMVDFFMEQATQLRTLTQPIPECATFSGEHVVAVQVRKATRREVYPGGPGFPGATVRATPAKTPTNEGGTTSNRTDTTKDSLVCRCRRDGRGSTLSRCQPRQVTNRETTTGRGREVLPAIEGQTNLHVPQDQICHGRIWGR